MDGINVMASSAISRTWFFVGIWLVLAAPFVAAAQSLPVTSLFHDGFEKLSMGDYDGAANAFSSGLKMDPKNALAHFYLGKSYLGLGKSSLAKDEFSKSLKLKSDSAVSEDARHLLAELNRPSRESAFKLTWLSCAGSLFESIANNAGPDHSPTEGTIDQKFILAIDVEAKRAAVYVDENNKKRLLWIDPRNEWVFIDLAHFNEVSFTDSEIRFGGHSDWNGTKNDSTFSLNRATLAYAENESGDEEEPNGFWMRGHSSGHGQCEITAERPVDTPLPNKL